MNKHVKSFPKVDKSITFHYCIVMKYCGLLTSVFKKKTTQIASDFLRFNFF